MKVIAHPCIFLNKASVRDRKRAKRELKAIMDSNPGGFFNAYTFWYRQTRVPAVRAALEKYFKEM